MQFFVTQVQTWACSVWTWYSEQAGTGIYIAEASSHIFHLHLHTVFIDIKRSSMNGIMVPCPRKILNPHFAVAGTRLVPILFWTVQSSKVTSLQLWRDEFEKEVMLPMNRCHPNSTHGKVHVMGGHPGMPSTCWSQGVRICLHCINTTWYKWWWK